jgi:3-phosphoshikimate 1-carboxyvinyltransferase
MTTSTRSYNRGPRRRRPTCTQDPKARRGFTRASRVAGRLRAPGSKSLAQRALVAAALADGSTRIAGLPGGDDVARALALIEACGASVVRLAPAAVRVDGRPPGPGRGLAPREPLELGESGTLARFALAVLGLCASTERWIELRASGTLARRRSDALIDALAASGVEFETRTFPVRLRPLGPATRIDLVAPRSSQELSGLLIALAAYPDENLVAVRGAVPSRPYVAMTRGVLARFGARVDERAGEGMSDGTSEFTVKGPLRAPDVPFEIEPDASLAAVALCAACIGGGELVASGLTRASLQGDVRIVEHLAAFGCDAGFAADGLFARGKPKRGARLDLSGEPDLAPPLVALAAAALLADGDARSEFVGLGTLPGKESSRIDVLARGLTALGFEVDATPTSLRLLAAPHETQPARLDAHGDHRMAFAFALLGMACDGVEVDDGVSVAKSWPGFWRELTELGAVPIALK